MTWMLTSTGAVVDLRYIAQDSISLPDIAHHLSQINRYTGACKRPYSVAEHSLLVCELIEIAGETDPSVRLAALMHDAHEAYTQDLSSPMKQLLGDVWHDEECRIQYQVLKRFGLLTAYTAARQCIDDADLTALSTERQRLLPQLGPQWAAEKTHPAVYWDFDAAASNTWLDWRQAFLDKFAELQFLRLERAREIVGDPLTTIN